MWSKTKDVIPAGNRNIKEKTSGKWQDMLMRIYSPGTAIKDNCYFTANGSTTTAALPEGPFACPASVSMRLVQPGIMQSTTVATTQLADTLQTGII